MHIEETVNGELLAVNSIAAVRRIEELLRENGTNSLIGIKDDRIDRCLWLLMVHRFGEFAKIDLSAWLDEIYYTEGGGQ